MLVGAKRRRDDEETLDSMSQYRRLSHRETLFSAALFPENSDLGSGGRFGRITSHLRRQGLLC
jgi:hypothetical protein